MKEAAGVLKKIMLFFLFLVILFVGYATKLVDRMFNFSGSISQNIARADVPTTASTTGCGGPAPVSAGCTSGSTSGSTSASSSAGCASCSGCSSSGCASGDGST